MCASISLSDVISHSFATPARHDSTPHSAARRASPRALAPVSRASFAASIRRPIVLASSTTESDRERHRDRFPARRIRGDGSAGPRRMNSTHASQVSIALACPARRTSSLTFKPARSAAESAATRQSRRGTRPRPDPEPFEQSGRSRQLGLAARERPANVLDLAVGRANERSMARSSTLVEDRERRGFHVSSGGRRCFSISSFGSMPGASRNRSPPAATSRSTAYHPAHRSKNMNHTRRSQIGN
jgi:hypothetical protein